MIKGLQTNSFRDYKKKIAFIRKLRLVSLAVFTGSLLPAAALVICLNVEKWRNYPKILGDSFGRISIGVFALWFMVYLASGLILSWIKRFRKLETLCYSCGRNTTPREIEKMDKFVCPYCGGNVIDDEL